MECKRCGAPMMLETVIKLRRSVFGFRETRSRGAYCATCKIAVPVESHKTVLDPSMAVTARPRKRIRGLVPWLGIGVSRPSYGHTDVMPLGDPVSLAT
jgi:hypothetical protein